MKIIANNGGFLSISQELIDSVNEIKTNQSQEENVRNIACLAHLIRKYVKDEEKKEDCLFFIDSLLRFTAAI